MKKIKTIFVLAACFLMLAGDVAFAARLKAYSGKCAGAGNAVGNWTVVLTFNDAGQVTRREGIRCDGTHWVDVCPKVGLTADPEKPSTYYTEIEEGGWVRFNTNSTGLVTEMWGRDAHGAYWEATATVADPSGDLN